MPQSSHVPPGSAAPSPWDARLARRLVRPLKDGPVTPNGLTTVRLATGLAAAVAFMPGTYGWSNIAALLLVVSNFVDHADGELARLSGKTSRLGHLYDLACDVEAVRDLLQEGPHCFETVDVTGVPWIEIDFAADVLRAEHEVLPRLQVSMPRCSATRLPARRPRRARGE